VFCQDLFRPLVKRDDSLNLATLEAQHAERMKRAQERFVTAAQGVGCGFEWRAPSGLALDGATLHARVAAFLVNLSQRMKRRGYSSSEIQLRMTREEMGSYLGMKLETVSRMLSRFQRDGIVETNAKQVRIVDFERLACI
jgi:CRP-like cAMP-binding protein